MEFKISGAFYRMSEPEGTFINMPQGMESYIILRFYEPMVIDADGEITVTQENACIIFSPRTSRQYGAVKGGFTNDYVSILADDSFIKKYNLPLNKVFYVSAPQHLSSHIGFIVWALTDVLHDHEKLIEEQVDAALLYVQDNIIPILQKRTGTYPIHERYVALRNEVQLEPSMWTVEKMAQKMHLSRSHFSVNYKNIFSISPKDDLFALKMSKAKRMLAEKEESVSAIAEKCGYSSTENFIRAFKKHFGVTPLAYRKQIK